MRPYLLVLLACLVAFASAGADAQPMPPRSPAPPGMPPRPPLGTAPNNPANLNPPPAPQMIPGTGCDTNYWSAMSSRGYMEGKHDMEAAQTIIGKPVSILEVSCFNDHLISMDAADMFSDQTERSTGVISGTVINNPLFDCTECGDGIIIPVQEQSQCVIQLDSYEPSVGSPCGADPPGPAMTPSNMGNTLTRVIRTSGLQYLNLNFPRPTTLICPGAVSPPGCATMNGIWNAARMHDFDKSTFLTFYEMVWSEPRAAAAFTYGCTFGAAPGTYFPRLRWDIAFNGRRSPIPPYPYQPGAFPPPSTYYTTTEATLGGMDTAETHLGAIRPPTATPATTPPGCAAQQPIPTGMQFYLVDAAKVRTGPYRDAICAAPGCRFDYTAGATGRCVDN